ncbi:MAG: chemotaxis protein CheW [Myxococcales bacterium]|nr:chemotaxis protein CheW [Myxococcales bacterium]
MEQIQQSEHERSPAEQLLTFRLADQEYAVDILRVQEIRGWTTPTSLPNVPVWIKGIVNLRGTIVPIVDLRERFGLFAEACGATTVVIVLRARSRDRDRVVGVVVDSVNDVVRPKEGATQPPPDLGTVVDLRFVLGLVSSEERLSILLDVDTLLDFDTIEAPGLQTRTP